MQNNLKEIKTTIVGGLFLLIGTGISLYEYFTISDITWQHYLFPIGFIVAGIGFLFAPDRFIDFLFKWANKKVK